MGVDHKTMYTYFQKSSPIDLHFSEIEFARLLIWQWGQRPGKLVAFPINGVGQETLYAYYTLAMCKMMHTYENRQLSATKTLFVPNTHTLNVSYVRQKKSNFSLRQNDIPFLLGCKKNAFCGANTLTRGR